MSHGEQLVRKNGSAGLSSGFFSLHSPHHQFLRLIHFGERNPPCRLYWFKWAHKITITLAVFIRETGLIDYLILVSFHFFRIKLICLGCDNNKPRNYTIYLIIILNRFLSCIQILHEQEIRNLITSKNKLSHLFHT